MRFALRWCLSPLVLAGVASRRNRCCAPTARPGDLVAVTGYLGDVGRGSTANAGESPPASPAEAADYLTNGATGRPEPNGSPPGMGTGPTPGCVTAMDISDGLSDDLAKLCLASRVSAQIEADRVPIHPLLRETFPDECLAMALNGGEDYHLLFVASLAQLEEVNAHLLQPATVVGRINAGEPGRVTVVDSSGAEISAARRGWDHFAP